MIIGQGLADVMCDDVMHSYVVVDNIYNIYKISINLPTDMR